jgi:hypothetical protein
MENLNETHTDQLIQLFDEKSTATETKEKITTILLIRAIEKQERSAKIFFFRYYQPFVKRWIRNCVYKYQIPSKAFLNNHYDWEMEAFKRFFKAIKKGKFVWKSTESTSKYLKSICFIVVLDDKDVSIRSFKREVQRSFRINIEKKGLTRDEKKLLKSIAEKLSEPTNFIIILSIDGYSISEICNKLDINPCDNKKIWNIKEAAYWKLRGLIENRIRCLFETPVINLKDKLYSEVKEDSFTSYYKLKNSDLWLRL